MEELSPESVKEQLELIPLTRENRFYSQQMSPSEYSSCKNFTLEIPKNDQKDTQIVKNRRNDCGRDQQFMMELENISLKNETIKNLLKGGQA